MARTLTTGLLGFVSGFAQGKVSEIQLEEKRAYDEALRLRVSEAAMLKERRLLTLREEFKVQQNVDSLVRDGLRNEDGTFNNTELLPEEVAAGLNDSNVRAAWEQYFKTITTETSEGRVVDRTKAAEARALERKLDAEDRGVGRTIDTEGRGLGRTIAKEARGVNRAIAKEERQIDRFAPGTTVSTRKDTIARLKKEGTFRTADVKATKGIIKTNYSLAKSNARAQFKSQVGAFSSTNRKDLAQATLADIDTIDEVENIAYKSMIGSQALNAVIIQHDDLLATNFESLENITSTQLVQVAAAKATEIDRDFRNIAQQLESKMQAALDKDPDLDKTKFAKALINKLGEFTSTEGKKFKMNPKQAMKDENQWHESMEAILMNTLTALRPTIIEEPGFFKRLRN